MQNIRIIFLGTSAGTPSRERNVAAVAVILDGTVLLFDCGEGTQHQLLRAPVRTGAIDAIFLTHLHGDHVYGLPGLLASMSMNNRSRPLDLIGPEGTAEYLTATLRTTHHHPIFDIRIAELPYRGDGYTVTAAMLDHVVPCLGYCVIEDDRPGEFDPEKARALGIPPGPQWGELQRAHDPRVTGPERRGRRIVYCTDTRPCAAATELAKDADVLIHESTYAADMATEAHERFHSTATEAARIAKDANAARLILTHFSPRYTGVEHMVEEARGVFANAEAAHDFAEFGVASP
jgi:ribonuclease Z